MTLEPAARHIGSPRLGGRARGLERVLIVLLAAFGPRALPGLAQERPATGYDLGVSLGVFADYPDEFAERYCEEGAAGPSLGIARRIAAAWAIEGRTTLGVPAGSKMCVVPLLPAPVDGQTVRRTELDEAIPGQALLATDLTVRFEPLPGSWVSPRLRLGGGRIWDKRLWNWVYGAGARVAVGSSAITVEAVRWNLGYDLHRELVVWRDSGAHELVSREVVPLSRRPWFLSVGWERRIG